MIRLVIVLGLIFLVLFFISQMLLPSIRGLPWFPYFREDRELKKRMLNVREDIKNKEMKEKIAKANKQLEEESK